VGANLREIVVLRRTDDWRLMATRLDLRGALLGKRPCPADDVWVRDSDIIIVPKSPILLIDDFIELVFTRGVYGVIPFQGISIAFAKASTI
jgi:polysaccharide export outer membrane protein